MLLLFLSAATMYGDSHHAHAYPFAEQEHYLHQRRRRRTGLYQFMTPDRYIPGQEIYLHDIILALKEHTTSTGLPHIHHSRGRWFQDVYMFGRWCATYTHHVLFSFKSMNV